MQTLWDTLAGPPAAIPGPAPAGGEPQGAITRRQRRPLRRDPRPPHRRARARPSLPRKPDQAAPRVPDSAGEAPPAAAAGPLKWRSPRQPADASKELEGEGGATGDACVHASVDVPAGCRRSPGVSRRFPAPDPFPGTAARSPRQPGDYSPPPTSLVTQRGVPALQPVAATPQPMAARRMRHAGKEAANRERWRERGGS